MQNNGLLEILLSIPLELQFGLVLVMGVLFIRVYMTRNNKFKNTILISKKTKEDIIKNLLKNTDALHYLTTKIIKDMEIIGVFNTETVILAMQAADKIEKLEECFVNLDDAFLSTTIFNYKNDIKTNLVNIYFMENNLYENKKRSEQLLLTYDRQINKLNADTESDNSERITGLKQSFKKEMSEYKSKIAELEKTYHSRRDDYAKELEQLNEKNEQVQNMLNEYRRKNIDTKKLYIKQLVYA